MSAYGHFHIVNPFPHVGIFHGNPRSGRARIFEWKKTHPKKGMIANICAKVTASGKQKDHQGYMDTAGTVHMNHILKEILCYKQKGQVLRTFCYNQLPFIMQYLPLIQSTRLTSRLQEGNGINAQLISLLGPSSTTKGYGRCCVFS